ncbi:hypothetical protein NKR23_g2770 [Pleurostoma richardsiae]|uniref:Protein YAE1 n=1 Tax=Pleurostoma richardsiae TaxID=41990 RepID=A0AA38RPE3_9PEZI|nr:hypothetical protein NKR23_g2770 [Pleurostoma richardsiae]
MQLRQTDAVDDFISMGPSPTSREEEEEQHQHIMPSRSDPLDDVFGADEEEHHPHSHGPASDPTAAALDQHHLHPSDIRRLREEHATAGYREGVAIAKAQSVQAGFDEGFSLGATVGARAGQLLGVLEGIANALRGAAAAAAGDATAVAEAEQADRLLTEARAELGIKSVFGEEYWAADGTWKYAVEGEGEGGGGGEVLFSDVAESHPLVKKWAAVVEAEMGRWSVDRAALEGGAFGDAAAAAGTPEAAPKAKAVHAQPPRDALNW